MSEGNVSATNARAASIGTYDARVSQIEAPTIADEYTSLFALAAEDIAAVRNGFNGFPHPWMNPQKLRDADPIHAVMKPI